MEFEELQKIWDSQYNRPLYALDEKALHNRIESKRKKAHYVTRISELLAILVNLASGSFVLAVNLFDQSRNIFMYLLAAWMLCTGFYAMLCRVRRIRGDLQFDRSMYGDLHHAISMATYQVRLSQLMRWNILPIAALTLLAFWWGGKSIWIAALFFIFFALTYYASGWEHNIYTSRKRELELLKDKLASEK
jgi:hypothetical protein